MIWLLVAVFFFALGLLAAHLIRSRAGDLEEVILQGQPVLLRCGKRRVEGKAPSCSLETSNGGSC